MNTFETVCSTLRKTPYRWLVTGAAGFIGSHLVENLLELGQEVVGLDDFSTGHEYNLAHVQSKVSESDWKQFSFIEGSIEDFDACLEACSKCDYVLHQAALCSVPQSIEDPLKTQRLNDTGFLNVLIAARQANVRRLVYASSSAVYGTNATLPKKEELIGSPLSPYAASKRCNEINADTFYQAYGFESIGLRYFNVFGQRQDPNGAYAAVIPRWIHALLDDEEVDIFGDGKTTRDFCHVSNVVQANILAATSTTPGSVNQVYNVATGHHITLNELYQMLKIRVSSLKPSLNPASPVYLPSRSGDIVHSYADISKAKTLLGYIPSVSLSEGITETLPWYSKHPSCV